MKQTLLIAESDAELRDIYRRFFSDRGYSVETTSDGLDCLKKLCQASPAVLVLDRELRWGGADGVLAWLREEAVMTELPVVLTATAACPDVAEDHEPPVVKFLAKPFTLAALLDSVRTAVAENGGEEPIINRHHVSAYSELFID